MFVFVSHSSLVCCRRSSAPAAYCGEREVPEFAIPCSSLGESYFSDQQEEITSQDLRDIAEHGYLDESGESDSTTQQLWDLVATREGELADERTRVARLEEEREVLQEWTYSED